MNELLPCPFCGGKNVVIMRDGGWFVMCNGCTANGPIVDHESSAITKWNTRHVHIYHADDGLIKLLQGEQP